MFKTPYAAGIICKLYSDTRGLMVKIPKAEVLTSTVCRVCGSKMTCRVAQVGIDAFSTCLVSLMF